VLASRAAVWLHRLRTASRAGVWSRKLRPASGRVRARRSGEALLSPLFGTGRLEAEHDGLVGGAEDVEKAPDGEEAAVEAGGGVGCADGAPGARGGARSLLGAK
jgi:hypothetical protein